MVACLQNGSYLQCVPTDWGSDPTDGFARLWPGHGGCIVESSRGRTDSFAFFFSLGKRKIKVSIPSSRDRATVHRTVALKCSNPPPNAEKDQSERIGLFLAGLTEMNLRRIFERKIRSRSSKNTPYLYDPRTFETENKGWSK